VKNNIVKQTQKITNQPILNLHLVYPWKL